MENTLNGWDIFFRIWAVAGPLLAAAASALWSRYTHVKDRDFEYKQELDRERRQATIKHQQWLDTQRKEKYNEIKTALADFMASSHEYVRRQSEYYTRPVPELLHAATTAYDKFIFSSQIVVLLGNDALANSVIQMSNATNDIPKSYITPVDDKYEEKLRVYRESRAAFNAQARSFLMNLESTLGSNA
jgi:hypothetical protein